MTRGARPRLGRLRPEARPAEGGAGAGLALVVVLWATTGCSEPAPRPPAPARAQPYSLTPGGDDGTFTVDRLRFCGTLELPGRLADGTGMHELSGLAWDQKAGLLYAVSDEGRLFHLRPRLEGGRLVDATVEASFPLLDEKGARLTGSSADAEGLALDVPAGGGPPTLLVSFEQEPRVVRFTLQGRATGALPLAAGLRDVDRYDEDNHALEAVTLHPTRGVLVAPERALMGQPKGEIPIFQLDGRRVATFVGTGKKKSAYVDHVALPDGRLVVLERTFDRDKAELDVSLFRVTLPEGSPEGGGPARVERLGTLASEKGYRHDNYEGLALLEGERFLLVSDDNGGPPQRTLLSCVEIVPEGSAGAPPAKGKTVGDEGRAP